MHIKANKLVLCNTHDTSFFVWGDANENNIKV